MGRLLGKLQQALQQFDEKTREKLRPLTRLPRNALPPADDLKASWEKIQDLRDRATLLHPFARLLALEPDVDKWVSEAISVRRSQHDEKRFLLLHDVHPHNVWCKNGECVLIYDYQWLGFWPHGHVVAFALHRFVRKLMVKGENTDASRERIINESPRRFLASYRESCALPLPEDFATNLGAYIKSSNMDKLLHVFWYGLSGYDPLQRTEARLFGEARKFIRCMKEAGEFEIA